MPHAQDKHSTRLKEVFPETFQKDLLTKSYNVSPAQPLSKVVEYLKSSMVISSACLITLTKNTPNCWYYPISARNWSKVNIMKTELCDSD